MIPGPGTWHVFITFVYFILTNTCINSARVVISGYFKFMDMIYGNQNIFVIFFFFLCDTFYNARPVKKKSPVERSQRGDNQIGSYFAKLSSAMQLRTSWFINTCMLFYTACTMHYYNVICLQFWSFCLHIILVLYFANFLLSNLT